MLMRDSISPLKLRRRGVRMGTLADLTILKRITVENLQRKPAPTVGINDPLQTLLDRAAEINAANFVVLDGDGAYHGLVVADDVKTALLQPEAVPLLVVAELVRAGVPTVKLRESLDTVLDKFVRSDVPVLAISADESHVDGLITFQAMMDRYQMELDRQAG